MKIACPECKTKYNLASALPSKSSATVVCNVCKLQFDVFPGGITRMFIPKVVTRPIQDR